MPKVLEIDVLQNTINEREMNETELQELAHRQHKAVLEFENKKNVLTNRANALAKLEALGLTTAEIAALVGA